MKRPQNPDRRTNEPLAIVGMGCRFPGRAHSPEEYWKLLVEGRDAVIPVPRDRWDWRKYYDPDPDKPGTMYMKEGGFLQQNIREFDALFFGISPREARILDPQQRLVLETAWEAIEDAGLQLDDLWGSNTGVFMGGFFMEYQMVHMGLLNEGEINSNSSTGVTSTLLSNRISYTFNLKGPSVSMDTACSSSLVATHYACQSLWNGECQQAIVGGANLMLKPSPVITLSKGRFLSTTGRCLTFDARGDGYGRGEGVGVVILKPLTRALADGDRIRALIRATGVNQDGRTPGITLPNPESQGALIQTVYARAGVEPNDVQYVEAHGTGTKAGDATELTVLDQILSPGRAGPKCVVGSVKANIGHLEAAAGIAGLIKTALCLEHDKIPANIHFHEGHPDVDFDRIGLHINTAVEDWPRTGTRRLAGINSFGYGGTNAHVLLEGHDRSATATPDWRTEHRTTAAQRLLATARGVLKLAAPPNRRATSHEHRTRITPFLFPVSARSDGALRELARDYSGLIRATQQTGAPSFEDIQHSACYRRSHLSKRLTVLAESPEDLASKLELFAEGQLDPDLLTGDAPRERPKLAFVYTGMGPQWWGMGRELMEREPVFMNAIKECDEFFVRLAGWSLTEALGKDESTSRVTETAFAQPTNFAIQYALTRLWSAWGIEPDAILGHSVGEIAAAHAAGALSLEDALTVIYHRGRLQSQTDGEGTMLAVGMQDEEALELIRDFGPDVSLAAKNSYDSLTLSGSEQALDVIAQTLEEQGVFHRELQVSTAYHSAVMDRIEPDLLECLRRIQPREASRPLYSTVLGDRVTGNELDAGYWWRNVRQSVLFADGIQSLARDGIRLFVDVGPHPVLSYSIKQCLQTLKVPGHSFPSILRKKPERTTMLRTLASLHNAGVPIDFSLFAPRDGRFARLPTYRWQREEYWSESDTSWEERVGNDDHPFLAFDLRLPHPAWEVMFNRNFFPFLEDHVVQGSIVNPGANYVEAGLVLHQRVLGDDTGVLENVSFRSPLLVHPTETRRLQLRFDPDTHRFSVHSRAEGSAANWQLHADGELVRRTAPVSPPTVDLDEIRARCTALTDVDEFYTMLSSVGLVYGPMFRQVRAIHRGADEVLVRVGTHPDVLSQRTRRLHPCQLDPCFQAIASTLDDDNRPFLPVRLKQVTWYRSPAEEFWCHLKNIERSASEVSADAVLCSTDGQAIAHVAGIVCRALPSFDRSQTGFEDRLYQFRWEETGAPADVKKPRLQKWLLFLQPGQESFAEALQASGLEHRSVYPSARFEVHDNGRIHMRPDHEEDWQHLVTEVEGFPFDGVVYLWTSNLPDLEADLRDGDVHVEYGDHLLAFLLTLPKETFIRRNWTLGIIHEDANAVAPGDACAGFRTATLWGLGRVLMHEHPNITCRRIDIPAGRLADYTDRIIRELVSENVETEVAFRDEQRYVNRLMTINPDELTPKPEAVPTSTDTPIFLDLRANAFVRGQRTPVGPTDVEIQVTSVIVNDTLRQTLRSTGRGDFDFEGVVTAIGEELDPAVLGYGVGEPVSATALEQPIGTFVQTRPACVHPRTGEPHEESLGLSLELPVLYALERLTSVTPGEAVFVTDPTTGFGRAALRVLRQKRAAVITPAKNDEHEAALREVGISEVLPPDPDVARERLRAFPSNTPISIVIDTHEGQPLFEAHQFLKPYGAYVIVGARDRAAKQSLFRLAVEHNFTLASVDLPSLLASQPSDLHALMQEPRSIDNVFGPRPQSKALSSLAELDESLGELLRNGDGADMKLCVAGQEIEALRMPERPKFFREDSTYVVTGGTRGLGLEVSKWAVEQGARHIVMISRRGAVTDEAAEALEQMRGDGVNVRAVAVDAADYRGMRKVFDDLKRSFPPIRGIFHGAMVLDDVFIQNAEPDRMRKVLDPKIKGAMNLYRLTRDEPLDYFFCFSSVSSLIGNLGQVNYIAANAFLDAFAPFLRAHGIPATTVNLGVIADVGVVSENSEIGGFFESAGFGTLKPPEVCEFLEFIHGADTPQIGFFDLDWSKWNRMMRGVNAIPLYRLLGDDTSSGNAVQREKLRKQLKELDEVEQQKHLLDIMLGELSTLLQMPADKIDPGEKIVDLGVNSLMAVELAGIIAEKYGMGVPILDIMSGSSTAQVSGALLESVLQEA